MNIASGILVFVIAWWLVFFMLLPLGVRAQNESDEANVPGTPESAPRNPMLVKKALGASVAAAIILGIFYVIMEYKLISLS